MSDEIAAELKDEPSADVNHFLVHGNEDDPLAPREIGGVDTTVDDVESMTRLLTLSSLVPLLSCRHQDPALDFSKLLMLTSNEYVAAVEYKSKAKIDPAEERQRNCALKEEHRKLKEAK